MLKYLKKKKSLNLLRSKTAKNVLRLIALVIFIILYFFIPFLSILGLVLFYTIFWTDGIFEYSIYLLWVNTIIAWIKLVLLFLFTFSFGQIFWYAWVYWIFTHLISICLDICIWEDCKDAYIRTVNHNLILEQNFKEHYNKTDFSKFPKTPKGIRQKIKFKIYYGRYDPYDVDIYQILPKGSHDFLNNYFVHGEDFYYKYYRPELNITFQDFFKKILKFITNDKIPDFLVNILFKIFCFFLPKPIVDRLKHRSLIHMYLYSWTNGFNKIIDPVIFCIVLYPFSFFYFKL